MENKEDSLEKFVHENLGDFDSFEPSSNLWDKIQEDLEEEAPEHESSAPVKDKPQGKVVTLRLSDLYKVAAVLAIGFFVGWMVFDQEAEQDGSMAAKTVQQESETQPEMVQHNYYVSLSDISPDLAEVEQFYSTQINEKMTALQGMNVDQDFLVEVDALSADFDELQKEISASVDNERVIAAMVQNYKIRLEVLESILEELRRVETEGKAKQKKPVVTDIKYI